MPLTAAADASAGGRAAVTTHAARVGSTLLTEAAVAAVPTSPTACWRTLTPACTAVCGGCKIARYVSRSAQAADRTAHAPECRALASGARLPPPSVRLALRVAALPVDCGGEGAPRLDSLVDHWSSLPPSRRASLAAAAAAGAAFATAGGVTRDVRALATVLAALAVNAHTVADTDGRALGVALFPLSLLANHADAPSACQTFELGDGVAGGPPRIVLRTLRGLAPGEAVTLSYTDQLAPRPERRAALLAGYCFDIDAGRETDPPPARTLRGDGWVACVHATAPPSVQDGRPASLCAVRGVADGGACGLVAWEAEAEGEEDAAASFPVGDDDDDKTSPPLPPPTIVHVIAWGAPLTANNTALQTVATAAADGVRATTRARGLLPASPAAALSTARAAAAALAASPGPAPAPTNLISARLADVTASAGVAAGDFETAVVAAAAALPAFEATHARGAPPRAAALAAAAKLAAHRCTDDLAAAALAARAAGEAGVAFGETSAVAREMGALAAGLAAEAAAAERDG